VQKAAGYDRTAGAQASYTPKQAPVLRSVGAFFLTPRQARPLGNLDTGGTGKYEGAGGGGTYTLEQLTDTLLGGKYKGTIELP
jgi:hypothetical protein